MTLALYGLLALVVGGALFLLAACLLPAGEQIAPPIRDEPVWELPADRRLDPVDVAAVRLPVALRGYRFRETDLLLDRLADELRGRDEEIAMLRGDRPADAAPVATADSEAGDVVPAEVVAPEVTQHGVDAAAEAEPAVDAPRTSADAGER
jgi:hypothetical protein